MSQTGCEENIASRNSIQFLYVAAQQLNKTKRPLSNVTVVTSGIGL
jgi:hypothetical protein